MKWRNECKSCLYWYIHYWGRDLSISIGKRMKHLAKSFTICSSVGSTAKYSDQGKRHHSWPHIRDHWDISAPPAFPIEVLWVHCTKDPVARIQSQPKDKRWKTELCSGACKNYSYVSMGINVKSRESHKPSSYQVLLIKSESRVVSDSCIVFV